MPISLPYAGLSECAKTPANFFLLFLESDLTLSEYFPIRSGTMGPLPLPIVVNDLSVSCGNSGLLVT